MEIEVGEYVRTRDGKIGKIIDITNITGQTRKKYLVKWDIAKAYYITTIRIINHSKNIIDLIEVRRLRKWNIGNRKRKHVIIYRIKRNR